MPLEISLAKKALDEYWNREIEYECSRACDHMD